jgi:hypothetical protein
MPRALLTLSVWAERYAICHFPARTPVPEWAMQGNFSSVTVTIDEVSIICGETLVPHGTECEPGWRLFRCEGPLDFSLTGIMASIAEPLADANITIFPIATYDTDYVLVRETQLEETIQALTGYGHAVSVKTNV